MQMVSTGLRLREGVLLAHALVAHIAADLGIRAFFIKGPVSALQGLREPRESVDVDVFVDPGRMDSLVSALRGRGWLVRAADPDEVAFPQHSVTLFHPEWPNDIDVHYRYPGMERRGAEVFEAMWSSTEEFTLAGQRVRVPSAALGVCFLALHGLRSPWLPASSRDLEYLAKLDLDEYRSEILELAESTGAVGPMWPFLRSLLADSKLPEEPATSDEWKRRMVSKSPGTARILAMMSASYVQWPGLLWRALFPPKEGLLAQNLYADVSFRGRLKYGC